MIDIPDSIFPKDDAGRALCPRCKKTIPLCDCPAIQQKPQNKPRIIPKISIDKSGRKGKVVTVIQNLPTQESYLKELAKNLKTKTGSGGTFYIEDGQGVVEIQGDHREVVRSFLEK